MLGHCRGTSSPKAVIGAREGKASACPSARCEAMANLRCRYAGQITAARCTPISHRAVGDQAAPCDRYGESQRTMR